MSDEIDLKKFADYLQQNPSNGSTAPPRTVPAKALDKNFKKLTLIKDPEPDATNDRTYKIKYTDEGTILRIKKLPRGSGRGDILYWNPDGGDEATGAWEVLEAIESEDLHVLTLTNRELAYTKPPRGVNDGDILYWNSNGGLDGNGEWAVFSATDSDQLHLLGISGGSLQWVPTAECEDE